MNYQDRLRRLSVNDAHQVDVELGTSLHPAGLDLKTLTIARLASLIAIGGPGPSFGEHVDAALSAGATTDEIVDVLSGIGSVVGVPRVVAAAASIASALGVDVESAFD